MRKSAPRSARQHAQGVLRRRAWVGLWLCVLGLALATVALQAWHGYSAFRQRPLLSTGEMLVVIEPGTGFDGIVNRLLIASGRGPARWDERWYWRLLERESDIGRRLQAGEYRVKANMLPADVLQLLASGKVAQYRFTILEGARFVELRRSLRSDPILQQTLDGLTDGEVLTRIGASERHAEGLFLPETYQFPRGFSDLDLLQRAYWAMQRELTEQWEQRQPDLPLSSPYDALILASVVEKESGQIDEQPQVAGVFTNRLRIGMRLQSDPTVIYGLGDAFDGNLRRVDLRTDTPYNSYTRGGLPPTPIAMPGPHAIRAVLQPAATEALYFVARGDGRHHFSRTLREHNQAVARYQLGRR